VKTKRHQTNKNKNSTYHTVNNNEGCDDSEAQCDERAI